MATRQPARCARCGHMSYEDFIEQGLDFCDCPEFIVPTTDNPADPPEPAE